MSDKELIDKTIFSVAIDDSRPILKGVLFDINKKEIFAVALDGYRLAKVKKEIESNLTKSYDAKNMCECFRLMHCGIEIANGQGYIVDRNGIDADFLLDVKNHKYEYEELMDEANSAVHIFHTASNHAGE